LLVRLFYQNHSVRQRRTTKVSLVLDNGLFKKLRHGLPIHTSSASNMDINVARSYVTGSMLLSAT